MHPRPTTRLCRGGPFMGSTCGLPPGSPDRPSNLRRRLGRHRPITHEHVGRPLVCESARRPMPRDERRLAAQRPQFLDDRRQQHLVVAARHVRSPDRSLEQHVADLREFRRRMVEDHVTLGMPRRLVHVEHQLADRHGVALDQPAVGLEIDPRHAVFRPVLVEPLQPEAVGLVRALDRHAQVVRQRLRLAGMIDMAVRQQDLLDLHAGLRDRGPDLRQVAAGIDHRRLHRRGAPQDRAVLLDRGDDDDGGAERRLGLCHISKIGAYEDSGNRRLP